LLKREPPCRHQGRSQDATALKEREAGVQPRIIKTRMPGAMAGHDEKLNAY